VRARSDYYRCWQGLRSHFAPPAAALATADLQGLSLGGQVQRQQQQQQQQQQQRESGKEAPG